MCSGRAGARASEPIPLLLPISSWNPQTQSVTEFVAARLRDDFGLAGVASGLASEPRMALGEAAGQWLLPVLDGLDEVRPEWRRRAMARLEEFASSAGGQPFVVTCRSFEYERIAGELPFAAVIEILPVRLSDARAFLSYPESSRVRWEPVFTHLDRAPDHPLATVWSTALMVAPPPRRGRPQRRLATGRCAAQAR